MGCAKVLQYVAIIGLISVGFILQGVGVFSPSWATTESATESAMTGLWKERITEGNKTIWITPKRAHEDTFIAAQVLEILAFVIGLVALVFNGCTLIQEKPFYSHHTGMFLLSAIVAELGVATFASGTGKPWHLSWAFYLVLVGPLLICAPNLGVILYTTERDFKEYKRARDEHYRNLYAE